MASNEDDDQRSRSSGAEPVDYPDTPPAQSRHSSRAPSHHSHHSHHSQQSQPAHGALRPRQSGGSQHSYPSTNDSGSQHNMPHRDSVQLNAAHSAPHHHNPQAIQQRSVSQYGVGRYGPKATPHGDDNGSQDCSMAHISPAEAQAFDIPGDEELGSHYRRSLETPLGPGAGPSAAPARPVNKAVSRYLPERDERDPAGNLALPSSYDLPQRGCKC